MTTELDGTGLRVSEWMWAAWSLQLLSIGRDETSGVRTQPGQTTFSRSHKYYGAWFPERGAGAYASKVVPLASIGRFWALPQF